MVGRFYCIMFGYWYIFCRNHINLPFNGIKSDLVISLLDTALGFATCYLVWINPVKWFRSNTHYFMLQHLLSVAENCKKIVYNCVYCVSSSWRYLPTQKWHSKKIGRMSLGVGYMLSSLQSDLWLIFSIAFAFFNIRIAVVMMYHLKIGR